MYEEEIGSVQATTYPYRMPGVGHQGMMAGMAPGTMPGGGPGTRDNMMHRERGRGMRADQAPETLASTIYTPGFLRSQIGKYVRIDFLVGGSVTDRSGRLVDVGASYVLLESYEPGITIMCDLYAIKFVSISDTRTPMI